jgi:hypothetical protein
LIAANRLSSITESRPISSAREDIPREIQIT